MKDNRDKNVSQLASWSWRVRVFCDRRKKFPLWQVTYFQERGLEKILRFINRHGDKIAILGFLLGVVIGKAITSG